jgi:hypothetical protein
MKCTYGRPPTWRLHPAAAAAVGLRQADGSKKRLDAARATPAERAGPPTLDRADLNEKNELTNEHNHLKYETYHPTQSPLNYQVTMMGGDFYGACQKAAEDDGDGCVETAKGSWGFFLRCGMPHRI